MRDWDIDIPRMLLLLGATLLGGVADLTGRPAGASAPPASDPPSEGDVVSGFEQIMASVGDVTYEGDDIIIDGCPLADAAALANAIAALEADLQLAGDQLNVEMFEEYELGETFRPVSISCDFESTGGDSSLEMVSIVVADMRDPEVSGSLSSFAAQFDPAELDEPLPDGTHELFGACDESDCFFGWFGEQVVIAASVEFDDDTTPDAAAVVDATREIIGLTAANIAARANG